MKMEPKETSNKTAPYVAEEVKAQLEKAKKKVIDGDQDRVYLVTGREGLGKSTLALQLAYAVDNTLCLDDVCFNSEAFEERIRMVDKHKAVIFDEAFNGLSSKSALSVENKRLVRLLMECRQRNLFIFIVLPSIFLLEKYVAIFRSHACFNVLISKKNYKLRFYKSYNYDDKKKLYLLGKTMMDYSRPTIPLSYRFYSKLPPTISEEAYREKKHKAFLDVKEDGAEESRPLQQRNFLLYILNKEYEVSYVDIAKKLRDYGIGLDATVIGRTIHNVSKKVQNVRPKV